MYCHIHTIMIALSFVDQLSTMFDITKARNYSTRGIRTTIATRQERAAMSRHEVDQRNSDAPCYRTRLCCYIRHQPGTTHRDSGLGKAFVRNPLQLEIPEPAAPGRVVQGPHLGAMAASNGPVVTSEHTATACEPVPLDNAFVLGVLKCETPPQQGNETSRSGTTPGRPWNKQRLSRCRAYRSSQQLDPPCTGTTVDEQ